MDSSSNGECANGTREELAEDVPARGMRLMDYIPICIPTIEQDLLDSTRHDKRFLDFLKAHPSKDWFLRFGFVGRLSPLSFLRRSGGPAETPPPLPDRSPGGSLRRRFRVPFVRKINWAALVKYSKHWIKNPVNIAFLIWLVFVAAGLLMLFLVMTGILNQAIPSSSRRKKWTEIINQILNALFTIMCIYQHPKLFHHLVLLLRWQPPDRVELREVYCKDGSRRVWERAHLALVVALLHITCVAQYVLCGLYWGYTRNSRPDWAENLCIGVGIAAPVIAGVYMVYGPLGKKQNEGQSEEEESQDPPEHTSTEIRVVYDKRVVVTSPQWIGGVLDCWDDRTVCCASFFCTFCVFGWNLERLGFGNMHVHIVTFVLLVAAPFWVFNISALNVDDDTIRYIVGITGIVLCLFGLFYGGFWRIQMRKRFKLPANPTCCGSPAITDCAHWLFCWSCSLAQEVRTANFYDVEEDSFYLKEEDSAGRQVLVPLAREGESGPLPENAGRSYSCPAKVGLVNLEDCGEFLEGDGGFARSSSMRSATVHAMRTPPPLMQMEED